MEPNDDYKIAILIQQNGNSKQFISGAERKSVADITGYKYKQA